MKGTRAAVRYAKSFIQLTNEKGQMEKVLANVKMLSTLIEESRDFELLLGNPLVKMEQKRTIMNKIVEGKVQAITKDFIDFLISQKRESILKEVLNQFVAQYNEANGIAKVRVTTATKLDEKIKSTLIEKIKAKFNYNKIELEEKIDINLLGGVLLRIGDKQLDGSVRRQLNDIERELVYTR